MNVARIRGEGVAAFCCARLTGQAGMLPVLELVDRPKVPAIMLSHATQKLLQDVFQRSDLFSGLPEIDKRIVAWGNGAETLTLPHCSVVVSEQTLLDRIRTQPGNTHHDENEAAWRILTTRPLPAPSVEHQFGSRMAAAARVKLKNRAEARACWVESLDAGWLFLLPGEQLGIREDAWLLSVGGSRDTMLSASRLVAAQIADVEASVGGSRAVFPAHPRIGNPLCGENWLACGTAALGFDPLCGDGTGNAVREAILASAALCAVADGADVNAVLSHYRSRLLGGFTRHLAICEQFYRSGHRGEWWDGEIAALSLGLEWADCQLSDASPPRYRLNGFALEELAHA